MQALHRSAGRCERLHRGGRLGGPLFVAHYVAARKAYELALIGITLGADMQTTKVPCPENPAVRVNNLATSLEPFYKLGAAVLG